jgi:hypothetical protein
MTAWCRLRPRVTSALLLLLIATAGGCGSSIEVPIDPVAKILFAEGSGDLSQMQQNEIANFLGLDLSPDSTRLVDQACGQEVDSAVRFEDLNSDGEPEVIVDYGNTCTSGMAGTSVAVFIRDGEGHYRLNLGFPGLIVAVRPSTNQGFADLLIGGPGFCFALWRWTGAEYAHLRNEPQAPGGCDDRPNP